MLTSQPSIIAFVVWIIIIIGGISKDVINKGFRGQIVRIICVAITLPLVFFQLLIPYLLFAFVVSFYFVFVSPELTSEIRNASCGKKCFAFACMTLLLLGLYGFFHVLN